MPVPSSRRSDARCSRTLSRAAVVEVKDKPVREGGGRVRAALWLCEVAGLAAAYLAWSQGRQTWLTAAMLFALAIVSTLAGWFTARARQLDRWSTERRGEEARHFEQWSLMSHWTWDSLSAGLIAVGATILVLGFI